MLLPMLQLLDMGAGVPGGAGPGAGGALYSRLSIGMRISLSAWLLALHLTTISRMLQHMGHSQ